LGWCLNHLKNGSRQIAEESGEKKRVYFCFD
jgi:hypothetical protein